MAKLIATICVFITLFALCSADCSATAELRALYGLSNSLSSPQTYSDVNYCKSIKDGPVCCTDTQMNSFENVSLALVANLSTLVGQRDTFIKAAQNSIPLMQQSLESIASQAAQMQNVVGSSQFAQFANLSILQEGMDLIANSSELLALFNGNIEDDYTSYQKSRATCFEEMIQLQIDAYCASCDPNATSKGFNSLTNELSLSQRVCSRIQTKCSDYISAAEEQNSIIDASYGAQVLQLLVEVLQAVASNDLSNLANIEDSLMDIQGPTSYVTAPAETPVGCDDGSPADCIWICTDLFDGQFIDIQGLVVGGEADDSATDGEDDGNDDGNDGGRLLAKADSNYRMLVSGSFDPDSDESGVTVNFPDDPSGTNSQSDDSFGNLSFGNVFFSMMIVLASLMVL